MSVKQFAKLECHINRCLMNSHKPNNPVPIALMLAGKLHALIHLSSNDQLFVDVAQHIHDFIDKNLHIEESLMPHDDLVKSMVHNYISISSVDDCGMAMIV